MNSRIMLSALALVLLALGFAPSVSALTYEKYSSRGASALSKCNVRTGADTAYVAAASGQCVRNRRSDAFQATANVNTRRITNRITCTEGGQVILEQFSSPNATCTGDDVVANGYTTLQANACVNNFGQPAASNDFDVFYVDCDATALPANITNSARALGTQYFSDSACTQPENDVAGYPTVDATYRTPNVCKSANDPTGDTGCFGCVPFIGTFRQSNPAGLVAIEAYDAACTDWDTLRFTPLDGCQTTTLGSEDAGTLKTSYVRYTSAAAAVTSPVAWPVPAGNHVQRQECSDTTCSANCNLVGLDRTGVCRPDLTTEYGSVKALLSADGKYLMTSSYNDTACAQRVLVDANEHSYGGPCDAGVLTFAAAPSMTSPALVQLPLPPLGTTYYYKYGGQATCSAQELDGYAFVEPGFCAANYLASSPSSSRYVVTGSILNITSYESSTTCVAGGSDAEYSDRIRSYPLDQCISSEDTGSGRRYALRTSASSSSADITTLGGWYSTNLADQDATKAFVKAGGTNTGGSGQNPSSGTTTGTTTGTNEGGGTTASTGSAGSGDASADAPLRVTLRFNVPLRVAQTAEWQKNTTAMLANVMRVPVTRIRIVVSQVATNSFSARRRLLADATTVGVTVLPALASDASSSVSVSAALTSLSAAIQSDSADLVGVDTTYTAGLTPTVVGACADGSYTEECAKQNNNNNNAAAPRAQGVLGAAVLLAALAMAL